MTIVLVHGNPETEAIWDDLVPHLRDEDVVRLSPPGLGSAIPVGFDCSLDAYRDWLGPRTEDTNSSEPILDAAVLLHDLTELLEASSRGSLDAERCTNLRLIPIITETTEKFLRRFSL